MEMLYGKSKRVDARADRAAGDAFAGPARDQSAAHQAGILETDCGRLAKRGCSLGLWDFAAPRATVVS